MGQGVEFDQANGEVRLIIGDVTYLLRAPTFGEFRKITELNDKRITAEVRAYDVEPEPNDDKTEESLATIRRTQSILVDAIAGRLAFWRDVGMLLGADLPAIDDLPPWLGNLDWINKVTEHWIQFPTLALGASVAPGADTAPEAQ